MPYYKNLRAAGLNLLHQYHTGIVCNLHEHSMKYKLATYRNRYQQCLTSCIKHCPHQAFFFTEKGHWTRNICEVVSDTVWLLFYSSSTIRHHRTEIFRVDRIRRYFSVKKAICQQGFTHIWLFQKKLKRSTYLSLPLFRAMISTHYTTTVHWSDGWRKREKINPSVFVLVLKFQFRIKRNHLRYISVFHLYYIYRLLIVIYDCL